MLSMEGRLGVGGANDKGERREEKEMSEYGGGKKEEEEKDRGGEDEEWDDGEGRQKGEGVG